MSSEPGTSPVDAAITWIHLSDFHAGQRGESAWHQIDVALEDNVRKMTGRLGMPDLVLFTGDLANRGGRDEHGHDEYAKVDRLLDRLNAWLGAEVPVFAVPGNHDLVRPESPWDYSAFEHYEQNSKVRDALWKGNADLQKRLERLFSHYTEWMQRRVVGSLRKAGWDPHVSARMPGDLSVVVEKNGARLGLVGLNSAWTHLSDEAETRGLQLPAEQLHAALPPSSGNPLDWFRGGQPSFLLMHHPPGWLTKKATESFESELYPPKRFALALYGHMHEGRSEVRNVSGTGARAFYQSPSLFGLEHYGKANERKSFGYTWGRITARGEVRVWPQRVVRRGGGKLVFDRDQGFGSDEDELEGVVLVEGAPLPVPGVAARAAGPAEGPSITLGWQDPIPAEELKRYLAKVEAIHQDVPLIGFKTKARLSMQLRELYVPLDAVIDRGSRGREAYASAEVAEWSKARDASMLREEIPLANAFHRARTLGGRRGLVLLGDPGSGKTTHLAQVLLKVVRDGPESIGLPAGTVPVLLPLRKLEDREAGIPSFIHRQLSGPAFSMKPDFGRRLCERGKLLLLLDGLDEVASAEERAEVSRWIEAAWGDLPDSYIVVTCRYAGYTGSAELDAKFLELHLRPLDDAQMRTFVSNWYATVERELRGDPEQAAIHAEQGAKELLEILESREFTAVGKIFEMTRNPLLLTTLCLVHRDLGRLPHARAKLYEEAVTVLLERWRHRAKDGEVSIAADDAMEVLRPIASWMHHERRRRATKAELVKPASEGLAKLRHVEIGADAFLQAIRDDSGLLTGWSGEEYGFMHLGFQEFLAAHELRNRGLKDPRIFEELAARFGDSWWQEVILLMLALRSPSVFEELMRAVVRRPELEQWARSEMMSFVFAEAAEVSAAPFIELLRLPEHEGLLGQRIAVVELLTRRMPEVLRDAPELMRKFRSIIINSLFEKNWSGAGVPGSEVRAGPRVKVVHGVELVLVPGGRFLMGSPEGEEGRDSDEGPQHEVKLGSFWLARTPLTNAQYREYMKANPGVKEPGFWGDRQYNQDDQPVVGVSWEEAKAYCEWAGLLLPTEAQWEYACRAGTTTRYCSGDSEEDLKKVGWYVGNSGVRLHAVKELEPNGWGLYDMHGNVYEWCEDAFGDYATKPRAGDGLRHQPVGDADRVMRGGFFDFEARYVRSACRIGDRPGDRWGVVGFRPAQGHHQ